MYAALLRKAKSRLQAYRLLVYQRCPRLNRFKILDQREIRHDQYKFESWLLPGGHIMNFKKRRQEVVEIVTPKYKHLSMAGQIVSLPCTGESEHQEQFGKHINYITSVQTEIVSGRIYNSMLQEMLEYAQSQGAQHSRWKEKNCRYDSLSMLDVQQYHAELHVQTWHLDAPCQLIIRSQAIFELVNMTKQDADDRIDLQHTLHTN